MNSAPPFPSIISLAGPTAVGKSQIAIRLAEELGGEIISLDSMQVYRGLDIGTAKPSQAERARVPHHLIDVVDLSQTFDAAQFARLASQCLDDILSRGRVPILCGGTGLYFRALLDGLGEAPPSDAALRAQLEALPLPELLRELAERDPVTYQKIDHHNPRRIVRALEVVRLTGKPFSQQRADWQQPARDTNLRQGNDGQDGGQAEHPPSLKLRRAGGTPSFAKATEGRRNTDHASRITNHVPTSFGLARASADLHQRIDARVDEMFERGLVAETQELLKHGLAENRTASQALGYRQVVEYLRGQRSLPETIELVKTRTRQFAKRQMTWFKNQVQLTWLHLEPGTAVEATVQAILQAEGRTNSQLR